MAIAIVNVNNTTFSINGVEYLKNFMSLVNGDLVKILNVYDSRVILQGLADYSEFTIDGGGFASAILLQSSLKDVLFNRDNLGTELGYKVINNISDFNTLVTGGTAGVWLFLASISLDANKTIPSGVTLEFRSTQINLNTFTLTGTNTNILSGASQIFDTNGVVNGMNAEAAYPQWLGATGDGTTDDTTAIQKTIDLGLDINFGKGKTYIVNGLLFNKNNVDYFGQSSLKLKASGGNLSTMALNTDNVHFIDLEIDGNGANQSGGTEANNGIQLSNEHDGLKFTRCYFHDFGAPTNQPPNLNVGATYNKSDGVVSVTTGVGQIDNTLFRDCVFENCYAAIAIRADGDGFKVINCKFKHCSDNSIKTRTGMSNISISNCKDEDTRGMECWGVYVNVFNNYSLNSHRHGISGGVKYATITGNTIEHTTTGLDSLYAIEIGLAEQCRVSNNLIKGWEGEAAILMTDTAQLSKHTIISNNNVLNGSVDNGAIGSSNEQDHVIYTGNNIIDVTGVGIRAKGNNLIVSNNTIKDTGGDLTTAKITTCLYIVTGERHVIANNLFHLAGAWVTGDSYLSVMLGHFEDSSITGNYLYGGRNTINGGLENAVVQGNVISNVQKVINSDTGSQGAIFKDNTTSSISVLLDTGDYDGFAVKTTKEVNLTAVPTTGTWVRGDRVIYSTPSAAGKVGAVCVTAGTPGTWKDYGVIDA